MPVRLLGEVSLPRIIGIARAGGRPARGLMMDLCIIARTSGRASRGRARPRKSLLAPRAPRLP
jgi:hypothetical protein